VLRTRLLCIAVSLAYGVAYYMQAEYVMKVQVIQSKKQPPRFYVNIPLPLAAALDLQAHEEVQWQLIGRSDLRLLRLSSSAAKPPRRKK
jgi:hypothetical protein